MKLPYGGIFDFAAKSDKLEQVNAELEDPDVWNDPKKAQDLGKEKKSLENVVLSLTRIKSGLDDAAELFEMAKEEQDDDTLKAVDDDTLELLDQIEKLEFRRMFSNPMDPCNCFIDIQAGAGGTEAQDWASMILRQYLRYCERKGFNATFWNSPTVKSPAIKTATIKVEGDYAYGYLGRKPAFTALCGNRLSIRPTAATRLFAVFSCIRKSMIPLKSTSIRQTFASIPTVPPVRGDSTSTKRTPPSG